MYVRRRLGVTLLAMLVIAAGMLQALRAEAQSVTPLKENVEYVTGSNAFTGGHVVVQGKRLYVGAYGIGMRIFDISNPAAPVQIGEYQPSIDGADDSLDHFHAIHADAVPDAAVFDDRDIAVLNGTGRVTSTGQRTDHTDFFDATDAKNLKKLWTFVGPADGEAHNGDIVDARRLWLPSGGGGVNGLRIYDLNPLLASPVGEPTNLFRGNPVALWESSPYRKGRPVGAAFTHTHDKTIYVDYPVKMNGKVQPRDILLLAEGGRYLNDAGDTGSVFVIDITDPRNPVVLLRWLHERGDTHHPIRYHHEAQFLSSDPRVMLVTDEDLHGAPGCEKGDDGEAAGGVVAVRLSDDLTSATELSEWFIPEGTPAPVCSVHVFSSHGRYVFFGSYNAGLQVVDYSNPASPQRVGQYVTEGTTAWGAQYHKGLVYVGDMDRGLDVFRWLDPTKKNNKVKNGSFQSSANGTSPDAWSSAGTTSYALGGSDGERSVTAGLGGSWTSEPVDVVAGQGYGYSVDAANGGGSVLVEQLDAAGTLLSTVTHQLFGSGDGSFQAFTGSFTAAEGVTQVRVKLNGSLLGSTTFDNVELWEE